MTRTITKELEHIIGTGSRPTTQQHGINKNTITYQIVQRAYVRKECHWKLSNILQL